MPPAADLAPTPDAAHALAGARRIVVKVGSSLLIMAIIGGAIFPPVVGAISAASHIANGMIVPAVCFAFIAFYAFSSRPPAAVQAS